MKNQRFPKQTLLTLALGLTLAAPLHAASTLEVQCTGKGVCRESSTRMPLKILPRNFANIYKSKQAGPDNIRAENIKAFYPLYVFARDDLDLADPANPKGWYQVGVTAKAKPLGWMQAKDVLEWKQALIVSYTHPGEGQDERKRVLMFDDLAPLKKMVESDERTQTAEAMYQALAEKKVPEGVVSKEPQKFVDITEKFYMLPIIDFEMTDIDGDEVRYLQVAAAVPGARGNQDTLQNSEFLGEMMEEGSLIKMESPEIKDLGVDVVFVMDMTGSMQPYLDRTKAAITDIARKIGQKGQGKIRFGLVGYRDDAKQTPALKFTAKNFTPELVDAGQLVELLNNQAKAAKVSSKDYAEEVFAGVEQGLTSKWRENALHIMVLVGDASSHPVGHAQNTTGLDAKSLRRMAEDQGTHILALHLQDARATSDHPVAEQQFETLSGIRGAEGESALIAIDVKDQATFEKAVKLAAGQVVGLIQQIQGDAPIAKVATAPSTAPTSDPAQAAAVKMQKLIQTALVEYLGKNANPPKDLIVWALDRDLTDPTIEALEVRVLVSKEQLSNLIQVIEGIITAMKQAELTQDAFFDALSGIAAGISKTPEQISKASNLKASGLLPKFIESLPYRSDILSMDNEMYASMTPSERSALERGLEAKLELYRHVNEEVDGWVRMNESDAEGKKLYPLHLDALP